MRLYVIAQHVALKLIGLIIFGLFTMGAALAPGIGSWLVCRFFAGLFSCPPLTNFGGTTADLWSPAERTYVFPVLLCLCFLGPFLAPMVAAFIGASSVVNWQWTGARNHSDLMAPGSQTNASL